MWAEDFSRDALKALTWKPQLPCRVIAASTEQVSGPIGLQNQIVHLLVGRRPRGSCSPNPHTSDREVSKNDARSEGNVCGALEVQVKATHVDARDNCFGVRKSMGQWSDMYKQYTVIYQPQNETWTQALHTPQYQCIAIGVVKYSPAGY